MATKYTFNPFTWKFDIIQDLSSYVESKDLPIVDTIFEEDFTWENKDLPYLPIDVIVIINNVLQIKWIDYTVEWGTIEFEFPYPSHDDLYISFTHLPI